MRYGPAGIWDCVTKALPGPDTTKRRICPTIPKRNSVGNPHCGCPWQNERERCIQCESPDVVQTRILYPSTKCVKIPCNFTIPPVSCRQDPPPRKVHRPCAIDWTVDEPGPNDSYGLNGLNWYDWQMEYHNKITEKEPMREGLSLVPPPKDFPKLICRLPIECYSRSPYPVQCNPYPGRVNYHRDWRCCDALPPPPWKPPFA